MDNLNATLRFLGNRIQASKPDAVGHIFCHIEPECHVKDCRNRCFCNDIVGRVEKELNMRKQVAEALEK